MSSRAFAAIAGLVGLVLLVGGFVLADEGGLRRVIGLVWLAYGIGLLVAASFIAVGRNPLRR